MNVTPDDPRLTAYVLGELSDDELRQVEHAVAADPALRMALIELEQVHKRLVNALSPTPDRLLPRQRLAVIQAARHADAAAARPSQVLELPMRKQGLTAWQAVIAAMAAAAVVVAGFLWLPTSSPSGAKRVVNMQAALPHIPDHMPMEIALLPAPGPTQTGWQQETTRSVGSAVTSAELARRYEQRGQVMQREGDHFLRKVAESLAASPMPNAAQLPRLIARPMLEAAQQPTLPLPVHAGRSSLGWVVEAIRVRRQLPTAEMVRLEEMLQAFTLRPVGVTAVSAGVSVVVESLACPWRPSACLVLVSIRNGGDATREVAAQYAVDPAWVRRYRLLGFARPEGVNDQQAAVLPTRMPGKTGIHLALEVEAVQPGGVLGGIDWSVAGVAAPPVAVPAVREQEPSNEARFAALVCAFAHWLGKDPQAGIDTEVLEALARENASDFLPADRSDFVHLVFEAIRLATPQSQPGGP